MTDGLPLVSIVTPSYNKGPFIEETILSIRNQTYPRIEHIVVDGGSTDETLAVVRRYEDRLTWISEPDTGQSNAINKGWRMTRGDILAFLNADDTYMPDSVQTAVDFLTANQGVDMVYGDAEFIDEQGSITQHYYAGDFDLLRLLRSDNHIPQPSVFLRRNVLDTVGYIDEDLHLAMDLDYWIRISVKHRVARVPRTLATMRMYPDAKFVAQYYKAVDECLRILRKFFSNADLPPDVRKMKPAAFGGVHMRGSVDLYTAGQRGKSMMHAIRAILRYPPVLASKTYGPQIVMVFMGARAAGAFSTVRARMSAGSGDHAHH